MDRIQKRRSPWPCPCPCSDPNPTFTSTACCCKMPKRRGTNAKKVDGGSTIGTNNPSGRGVASRSKSLDQKTSIAKRSIRTNNGVSSKGKKKDNARKEDRDRSRSSSSGSRKNGESPSPSRRCRRYSCCRRCRCRGYSCCRRCLPLPSL